MPRVTWRAAATASAAALANYAAGPRQAPSYVPMPATASAVPRARYAARFRGRTCPDAPIYQTTRRIAVAVASYAPPRLPPVVVGRASEPAFARVPAGSASRGLPELGLPHSTVGHRP